MTFSDIVEKHFTFLVTQLGYSKILISDMWIKYRLEQQSVIVAYDSTRSYEVSVSLGDETDVCHSIPFHVLCLAYGSTEQVKQLSSFFSQQLPAIDGYLQRVSMFMQEKMQAILTGNQNEMKKVHNISLTESLVYTQARKETVLRKNAEDAWAKKTMRNS